MCHNIHNTNWQPAIGNLRAGRLHPSATVIHTLPNFPVFNLHARGRHMSSSHTITCIIRLLRARHPGDAHNPVDVQELPRTPFIISASCLRKAFDCSTYLQGERYTRTRTTTPECNEHNNTTFTCAKAVDPRRGSQSHKGLRAPATRRQCLARKTPRIVQTNRMLSPSVFFCLQDRHQSASCSHFLSIILPFLAIGLTDLQHGTSFVHNCLARR